MDELTEMRQQLAAMKESLDRTQLANSLLLRRVMKSKARFLNGLVWAEIISMPFVVILILANCAFYDATPWVAWAFLIGAAVDIAFDIRNVRLPQRDIVELPVLELRRKILRQKRQRRVQTFIGFFFVLAWSIWAFVAWFKPQNYVADILGGDPVVWFFIVMLAVLLVAAFGFAIWLLRKIDRTSDSILADLGEEAEEENK